LPSNRDTGDQHEQQAAAYLKSHGLTLVATKHHSRFGEIDLIMQDKSALVFVEVRYRRSQAFGGAALSVTPAKQRKIALTALHYLQAHNKNDMECRFDVVAVTGEQNSTVSEWIKNAFDSPL